MQSIMDFHKAAPREKKMRMTNNKGLAHDEGGIKSALMLRDKKAYINFLHKCISQLSNE